MGTLKYKPVKIGNIWYIKKPRGYLKTPNGTILGSTNETDINNIVKQINEKGEDPTLEWSTYALLASYFEFAYPENTENLLEAISSGLESDPIYQELSFILGFNDMSISGTLGEPIRNFLDKIGFIDAWCEKREKNIRTILIGPLKDILKKEIRKYSRKGLISFVYWCAHFSAPLSLLAYLHDKKTYSKISVLIKRDRYIWPFIPNELSKHMKTIYKFASLVDEREEVISNFESHKRMKGK